MAGELYLVAREEAREVLGVPAPLTRVPGAKSWCWDWPTCAASCCRSSTCAYLGGGATPIARRPASWWSTTATSRPVCWSMRCSDSGASPIPSLPPTCRRRSCTAGATSPARSAGPASSGRCWACVPWSKTGLSGGERMSAEDLATPSSCGAWRSWPLRWCCSAPLALRIVPARCAGWAPAGAAALVPMGMLWSQLHALHRAAQRQRRPPRRSAGNRSQPAVDPAIAR